MTSPTVALCMNVRDSANQLAQLLPCLSPLMDETVIVVDASSHDRTEEVARYWATSVISAPFEDDYSTFRNLSLRQVQSDWILVLDADEIVLEWLRQCVALLQRGYI